LRQAGGAGGAGGEIPIRNTRKARSKLRNSKLTIQRIANCELTIANGVVA
jgi:hypothetical protein